jgi:hypothetical protein
MFLEELQCHHCENKYFGDDRVLCNDCVDHGINVHFDFDTNEHITFKSAESSALPF